MFSVQQINTREINDNTKNFITVKETGKSKNTKLNHHQGCRNTLRNTSEIFPIIEFQEKPEPTAEENSMSPSFDHASSKRIQKKLSTKHNKQPEAYITNERYQEPLEQRKARIAPGRRTYLEATEFGKKVCIIGDSHLNRIKRNIFQKLVNVGKHTLMFFEALHIRD